MRFKSRKETHLAVLAATPQRFLRQSTYTHVNSEQCCAPMYAELLKLNNWRVPSSRQFLRQLLPSLAVN